ncbi:uncharacterized protein LOC115787395 [Archocentrus centrarchus]|uniref:uncharacterized protein LOC115787395 n=1 Tax=Archocentrus centrarchus TaxID=63155 RepID=UPI0011EA506D|nr:uncharacterized protein LOC115787395 [Archocentrus centrarchus]
MMLLWMTLLFLHQGCKLLFDCFQKSESATLTCALPDEELGSRKIHWYKQRVGDTLKIIVTLLKATEPQYASPFLEAKFYARNDKHFSKLTILETAREDEGMYHCGITNWADTEWSGTYLLIKGNTQRTSNYIVVQQPVESNPVRPGDTADLQCSVFSDSENETCPGAHNVFWFRAGSQPNIIYTDGNSTNQCEKSSETQKKCVYRFSKNIDSSDAGTYYCAVATCGEILFGNGNTLDIHESSVLSQRASTVFFRCAVVVITLIVIAALIYTIKTNNSDHCKVALLQKNVINQKRQQNKDTERFSAVVFTMMKVDRSKIKDTNTVKREQIYMAVKAFGLD